ncbi:single stranded DNA-binding protein [Xanthomonas phage BUDD]|nr:single stranded DNA-binding protein [Xanthomonas phage BUDD]
MRLDELQAEIAQDSNVDNNKLDTESLRIPMLHSKYYNYFIAELRILKGVEQEYKRIKKERHQYYLGQASDDVYKEEPLQLKILRQDLELYLDADPKLSDLKSKYELQKMKTEMLEAFIKTLNTRNFLIKNSIEFLRFKNGG